MDPKACDVIHQRRNRENKVMTKERKRVGDQPWLPSVLQILSLPTNSARDFVWPLIGLRFGVPKHLACVPPIAEVLDELAIAIFKEITLGFPISAKLIDRAITVCGVDWPRLYSTIGMERHIVVRILDVPALWGVEMMRGIFAEWSRCDDFFQKQMDSERVKDSALVLSVHLRAAIGPPYSPKDRLLPFSWVLDARWRALERGMGKLNPELLHKLMRRRITRHGA